MKPLVVVLAALATAQSAWAAPAPLRVTSISPQVAERGELVTIRGGGFGAHTAVTLAASRWSCLGAGSEPASFRVPALGAVGDVAVEARNPGGHVGRIGLTVRFDGRRPRSRTRRRRSASESADGGTIAVEGMESGDPGRRGAGGHDDHGDAAALAPGLAVRGSAGRGEAGALRARAAAARDADLAEALRPGHPRRLRLRRRRTRSSTSSRPPSPATPSSSRSGTSAAPAC